MLNKKYRFIVAFTLVLLALGLTLPACSSQKPVGMENPPSQPAGGALTFEAATYVNPDYGFSVKYPNGWKQQEAVPGTVFVASATKRVPAMSVGILDGATFDEALTAGLALQGSDIKIQNDTQTTLSDGTPATEAVVKWKTQNLGADTFSLGVQKDGKWIIVAVTTVSLLAKYDEALFSEIVHTLQFK
jgi:hypothetical protein